MQFLFLAAVPIAAQLLVFTYYAGFLGYFDIPLQVLSFNLTDVFILTTGILLAAALLFLYGDLVLSSFTVFPSRIAHVLQGTFLQWFIYFVFISLYFDYEYAGITKVLVLLGPIPLFALLEILTSRRRSSAVEPAKTAGSPRSTRSRQYATPLEKLASIVGARTMVLVGLLFVIYSFGRFNAMSLREFRVVNTDPESVLLWMTGDRAVTLEFDRSSKDTNGRFHILDLAGSSDFAFSLEPVGPLNPVHRGP